MKDHFAPVCNTSVDSMNQPPTTTPSQGPPRQSNIRHLEEEEEIGESGPSRGDQCDGESNINDCVFTVRGVCEENDSDEMISVCIGGVNVSMLIDSGCKLNIIPTTVWEIMKSKHVVCVSRKNQKQLFPYNSSVPLDVVGEFDADIYLTVRVSTAQLVKGGDGCSVTWLCSLPITNV